jgi:MYXO-CTERM domain-containing protein
MAQGTTVPNPAPQWDVDMSLTIGGGPMTDPSIKITGESHTELDPGAGGTAGVLAGDKLTFGVVPDSASTGFQHCTGGSCGLAGFVASVTQPLPITKPPPYPWTFNPLVFPSGTAGVGKTWTGSVTTGQTAMTAGGTTLPVSLDFTGREAARRWCALPSDPSCSTPIPEPEKALGLAAGLAGLVALTLLRGRRRSA